MAIARAESKPRRDVRPRDVVVDGLRHAHHGHALGPEAVGDPEAAIAPDDDQPVDAVPRERRQQRVRAVDVARARTVGRGNAEGIVLVGRAEDGPALDENAGYVVESQRQRVVGEQAGESIPEPHDLDAVLVLGGLHDRPEHRVHSGTVPAGRDDTHASRSHGRRMPGIAEMAVSRASTATYTAAWPR